MGLVINPATGKPDSVGKLAVTVGGTEPSNPFQGQFWIDPSTDNLFCYYGTTWWNIGTLRVSRTSGEYMGFGAFTYA